MTSPEDVAPAKPATKLPLFKRAIIAVRGGSGGGMLAVAVVGGLILILIIGAVIFSSGVAVAVKRNAKVEQDFKAQLKRSRDALAEMTHEKEAIEKKHDEAKSLLEAQAVDMKILRESNDKLRLEKEALDKVLVGVQERLSGSVPAGGGKAGATKPNCDNKGGPVRSKQDLECLNLREAIESMNGRSSKEAAPEPEAKPQPKPAAKGH